MCVKRCSLLKRKLKEYEDWRLTQWQIRNTEHTLQYSFWQRICTLQKVSKCKPLWVTSNLFVQNAHNVNKAISFTGFFTVLLSPTIACFDFLQHSPHALLSFSHDHIRIGEKVQIWDTAALGNTLINCQFWLLTGNTHTKGGCNPHLFFGYAHYLQ